MTDLQWMERITLWGPELLFHAVMDSLGLSLNLVFLICKPTGNWCNPHTIFTDLESNGNICGGLQPLPTTLSKVQKILRNATRSENTFQSFNIKVYENFFSGEFLLLGA